jgi:hypothetical protein
MPQSLEQKITLAFSAQLLPETNSLPALAQGIKIPRAK